MTTLHVEAGGQIGRHPAAVDQLFLVVSGADEELTALVVEMPALPLAR